MCVCVEYVSVVCVCVVCGIYDMCLGYVLGSDVWVYVCKGCMYVLCVFTCVVFCICTSLYVMCVVYGVYVWFVQSVCL